METNKVYEHPILCQPISTLPLSDEFKLVAAIYGFQTLSDLVEFRSYEIQRLNGFNIQLAHEYINHLEENKLGHLVDCY